MMDRLLEQAREARRDQRLDSAHSDFDKAIILSRRAGDDMVLARALLGKAQIARDRGRPSAAIPLYEEAVKLLRHSSDPLALASALRHLGDAFCEHEDYDDAQPCYDEALTIYRAVDDTPSLALANALRPMALLHEAQGATFAAEPLWQEAMALYGEAGIEAGTAECFRHLAALAHRHSASQ